MKPDNPIILALDYSNINQVEALLFKVRPHIGMVKIGLELWAACGKDALQMADYFKVPVFLDLKLHDVPTTVQKTTEVLCSLLAPLQGQHFLSIHCSGGNGMCKAAMEAAQGSNVTIAGVTLLTSVAEPELHKMGFKDCRPGVRTVDFADVGYDCMNDTAQYDPAGKRLYNGIRHFICAPNQAKLMKEYFDDSILICPGIRADSDDDHDHARTKPAGFALKNGATWLVVGRPITQSSDPRAAAQYYEEQGKKYG
jgi:orotidine-5'-phosphate decarboxylase